MCVWAWRTQSEIKCTQVGKENDKRGKRKILLDGIAASNAANEVTSRYYGEEDRKILQELANQGLVICEPTHNKLNWVTIYPKRHS